MICLRISKQALRGGLLYTVFLALLLLLCTVVIAMSKINHLIMDCCLDLFVGTAVVIEVTFLYWFVVWLLVDRFHCISYY